MGFALHQVICILVISLVFVIAQDVPDEGGQFQDLLERLQEDADGDGISDLVAAGIGGDGGLQLIDLINALPANLESEDNNMTEALPTQLRELLNQFGALPVGAGGPAGQIVQNLLLQRIMEFIPDFENADIVRLADGYAITPLGLIQEECYNDMARYITDLQDMRGYALKMTTSWGDFSVLGSALFSGNFRSLGIMEQCIDVTRNGGAPLDAQFCMFNQVLPVETATSSVLRIGTCWPKSCSAMDLKTTYKTVLPQAVTNVTDPVFTCVRDLPWSDGAIATISVLCLFGALVLLGTIYHLLRDVLLSTIETAPTKNGFKNGTVQNVYEQEVRDEPNEHVYANDHMNIEEGKGRTHMYAEDEAAHDIKVQKKAAKKEAWNATLDRVLMALSAIRNGAKILDCNETTSTLGALNGIRVLSMFWIILGHSVQFPIENRLDNPLVSYEYVTHYTFWAVLNAVYGVDTFFFLSGLLLTYITLRQLAKTNGKMNWALFYFHRFWRITPLYMVVLGIWASLAIYMGEGPEKIETFEFVARNCKDNWWTHLLYINNLYPFPGTLFTQCMGWGWYLANDMQFFVISPFILYLLFKFWKAGIASIILLLLVSFASSIYLTIYWGVGFGFSGDYNNRRATELAVGGEADIMYGKPYTRIPPYLVGVLLGFALYKINGRQIKLNKCANITLWMFAMGLSLAIIYGPEGTNGGDQPPQWLSVIYNTLSRFGFAVTLAWIVFACVTGNGGPVNTFLSWSFWTPLARLTFGAYLIHPVLIYVFLLTKTILFHFTYLEITYFSIANVVVSYAAAFVLALLVEGPTVGLEKALLGGGKKNGSKNK